MFMNSKGSDETRLMLRLTCAFDCRLCDKNPCLVLAPIPSFSLGAALDSFGAKFQTTFIVCISFK